MSGLNGVALTQSGPAGGSEVKDGLPANIPAHDGQEGAVPINDTNVPPAWADGHGDRGLARAAAKERFTDGEGLKGAVASGPSLHGGDAPVVVVDDREVVRGSRCFGRRRKGRNAHQKAGQRGPARCQRKIHLVSLFPWHLPRDGEYPFIGLKDDFHITVKWVITWEPPSRLAP